MKIWTIQETKYLCYGMIGASRISGTNRNLYGSSINHSNTISLRIKKGEKEKRLKQKFGIFGKRIIN